MRNELIICNRSNLELRKEISTGRISLPRDSRDGVQIRQSPCACSREAGSCTGRYQEQISSDELEMRILENSELMY